MSYYRPPMGDYKTYGYAGDPGFLSSLWKGIKKIAKPVIGGLIGGPVGAIIAGAGAAKVLTPPTFPQSPTYPGPAFPAVGYGGAPVTPGRGMAAWGPRAPGWVPPASGSMSPCPSGYHLAKDGSGRMVRNRRMNVANPRALRRAVRRTDGFVKLAKRALKGTGYAVRRS